MHSQARALEEVVRCAVGCSFLVGSPAGITLTPLHQRIVSAPVVHDRVRASGVLADLTRRCSEEANLAPLGVLMTTPQVSKLLSGIFGASPYLTELIVRNPVGLHDALAAVPEERFAALVGQMTSAVASAAAMPDAMRALRLFKSDIALLTALCDLGGVWPVMTVTRRLSEAADAAVGAAVDFLFAQARAKGDWLAPDPAGYIVLAMGKHGAFELNYSSDIDLIVFYDPARVRLRAGLEVQPFFVRLTRDLVRLLHERTEHGYVFRTDLRLRPDPGSTPLAISTDAAFNYYENVGQNWERAALIKARAIAGDIPAGESFLADLAPFIWRKYLDFAAIADIHAMKRQIHAFRGFGEIAVAGHDIKVGRGGIREIEFFVQTQQLIAGGRQPELRVSETLVALERLEARGWIKPEVRRELDEAYRFLRTIEHRLQMIADEQTQTLAGGPRQARRPRAFLRLCRHAGIFRPAHRRAGTRAGSLRSPVRAQPRADHGRRKHGLCRRGRRSGHPAGAGRPGLQAPRGRHRRRARMASRPLPRRAHAACPRASDGSPAAPDRGAGQDRRPDLAFLGFDRFLSELPSSVQLFSLLKQNQGLIELIAAIMGTAPRLARILSKRRRVLDAVLAPGLLRQRSERPRSFGHRCRRAEGCRRLPGSAGSRAAHRPRAGVPDRCARSDRHHQRRPGRRCLRASRRDASFKPCSRSPNARWSAPTDVCRGARSASWPWASSAASR